MAHQACGTHGRQEAEQPEGEENAQSQGVHDVVGGVVGEAGAGLIG